MLPRRNLILSMSSAGVGTMDNEQQRGLLWVMCPQPRMCLLPTVHQLLLVPATGTTFRQGRAELRTRECAYLTGHRRVSRAGHLVAHVAAAAAIRLQVRVVCLGRHCC